MNVISRRAWAVALATAVQPALAGGYTEGPDLSNNRLAPTVVPVDLGSNVVKGTSGYAGTVLDRDFFSITVAPGTQLTALLLGPTTVPGGAFSFIGMQAGSQLTVDPDNISSGAQLLGWHLYGSADVGTNILDDIGGGPDKIGFAGALPAGPYTFWIQELAPPFPGEPFPPYPYEFNLQILAVPEPASALMLLAGGLVGLGLRRRRRGVR
jgi:hypothetical protein